MSNASGGNKRQIHRFQLKRSLKCPPPPKKYSALSRKPTQADCSALYEDLKEYGWFTGLCWLINPEPPLANQLPFPTIEEIIFSEEFLEATGRQQQLDCLVRRSRLQETDTLKISELTVGQQDNLAWFLAKRGRLTASNFGSVLKAKRITPSLIKRLLEEYDLSRVKAVQWGVNNEEEAIKAFTLKTGLEVKETGIWFHSSGILGASPDGILEVKCPYTERNITIAEAVGSATFCLEKCKSGHGYTLKKDHVYWHQVQGELYFSQRNFCYFVVWTTKDIAIVKIERDETWVANIPVLTQFYFDNIFPRIVEGEL